MGRFDGLKGVILGVANDHSIAWAIAKEILAEGGRCWQRHAWQPLEGKEGTS